MTDNTTKYPEDFILCSYKGCNTSFNKDFHNFCKDKKDKSFIVMENITKMRLFCFKHTTKIKDLIYNVCKIK